MNLKRLLDLVIAKGSVPEDAWAGFARAVLPKDCSRTQRNEMRKSFYAGFYASFTLMLEVSSLYTEDEAANILENITNYCEEEIRKFWQPWQKDKTN